MAKELHGLTVAIVAADGFEQVEMTKPREALDNAGARTLVSFQRIENLFVLMPQNYSMLKLGKSFS
jgi:putative intracellular protease/amidase